MIINGAKMTLFPGLTVWHFAAWGMMSFTLNLVAQVECPLHAGWRPWCPSVEWVGRCNQWWNIWHRHDGVLADCFQIGKGDDGINNWLDYECSSTVTFRWTFLCHLLLPLSGKKSCAKVSHPQSNKIWRIQDILPTAYQKFLPANLPRAITSSLLVGCPSVNIRFWDNVAGDGQIFIFTQRYKIQHLPLFYLCVYGLHFKKTACHGGFKHKFCASCHCCHLFCWVCALQHLQVWRNAFLTRIWN